MTGTERIRVAAAQYPIDKLSDMGAVRDKLARWVAEAAADGAKLLLFPEYGAMELAALRGEKIAADVAASFEAVSDLMREVDAVHCELAAQHRVHILAGSGPSRRSDGRYVNAARLITPAARIGVQHKLVLTPFERDWDMAAGDALRVFETELGRIGIAICYDSEFPLLVRAQAEAGAELILIPACTERASGAHRVRTAALARALENTCACIVSPTVGDATWCPAVDYNAGIAGAYVPAEAGVSETGVLAEGKLNAPGWVLSEIDLEALRRLRTSGEMRNFEDWHLQPGAGRIRQSAQVVSLV
jgi:predicted amidohydrolase